MKGLCSIIVGLTMMLLSAASIAAQTAPVSTDAQFIDQAGGMTVDDAVAIALAKNAEVEAMRKEVTAGEALIKQARIRPNPMLEVSGTKQTDGKDYSFMIQGEYPLELGGRRGARIRIAERELDVRRLALAERERQLAAEVRLKFGEAFAAVSKVVFVDERVAMNVEHVELVAAQVREGRRAPLEESMERVEFNRLRAERERIVGDAEVRMFELKNLLGMTPDTQLRLKGDLLKLMEEAVLRVSDATETALRTRPDLAGARALEQLAAARLDQAKSEGRIDADVMLGYQRMKTGFDLSGFDEAGILMPISMRANFFTFGVRLNLPVSNRNQGMVESAIAEQDAARSRREFGELTIRREVAAAFARYERSRRAMEIYRVGVREQAAANVDVVRQTYELGQKTLLDYIAEHHRFMETEINYIDAQLEVYLSMVEMLKAANSPELIKK